MALSEEDLKSFNYIYRIDTGSYYFIQASYIEKEKIVLIALSRKGNLVYERAPFKPGWKWERLDKDKAVEILQSSVFFENRIAKEDTVLTHQMIEETEKAEEMPKTLACMVGNIVDEHTVGEEKTVVHGTKHFSPGTKVYCRPMNWTIDEQWKITGLSRQGKRLITVIHSPDCVTNLRAKVVYSPKLIEKLVRDYVYFDSIKDAEEWVESIREWRENKNN